MPYLLDNVQDDIEQLDEIHNHDDGNNVFIFDDDMDDCDDDHDDDCKEGGEKNRHKHERRGYENQKVESLVEKDKNERHKDYDDDDDISSHLKRPDETNQKKGAKRNECGAYDVINEFDEIKKDIASKSSHPTKTDGRHGLVSNDTDAAEAKGDGPKIISQRKNIKEFSNKEEIDTNEEVGCVSDGGSVGLRYNTETSKEYVAKKFRQVLPREIYIA
jgi:hypothetical protein